MAVFRVERNSGYTVMSNHHLRNKELTLKAKGLLSQMLSLPEDWDYTLAGLSHINRESIDAIRTAVWELEKAGYILRRQGRDEKGKMTAIEYTIYEQPQPMLENPIPGMLTLIPVSLAQANEFVRQHHRHHKPVAGHKFSIGCAENGRLCAVAIVGRPVSRYLDDGFTLEVNRLCSDGTKNACSILYAAAARAARAMGYRKIITYTLDTESGASLRAAGWTNAGLAGGKAWTGSRRPAQPLYPAQMKYRYEKRLNERSC